MQSNITSTKKRVAGGEKENKKKTRLCWLTVHSHGSLFHTCSAGNVDLALIKKSILLGVTILDYELSMLACI